MWNYLKHIYQHDNLAQRFHLEHELSQFTKGTMPIQEYYCIILISFVYGRIILRLFIPVYLTFQLQYFKAFIPLVSKINS